MILRGKIIKTSPPSKYFLVALGAKKVFPHKPTLFNRLVARGQRGGKKRAFLTP